MYFIHAYVLCIFYSVLIKCSLEPLGLIKIYIAFILNIYIRRVQNVWKVSTLKLTSIDIVSQIQSTDSPSFQTSNTSIKSIEIVFETPFVGDTASPLIDFNAETSERGRHLLSLRCRLFKKQKGHRQAYTSARVSCGANPERLRIEWLPFLNSCGNVLWKWMLTVAKMVTGVCGDSRIIQSGTFFFCFFVDAVLLIVVSAEEK